MEDLKRAFIQAFFVRNVLSFEEAQTLLASIFKISEQKEVSRGDVSLQDFESMISAANIALSPLDYEIRSAFHQQSRVRYYALVNTTSDAMTQVATLHSADEIAYVKRLLDELFDVRNTERQESLCISGKDALNLVRVGRRETQNGSASGSFNLSAHEAEVLLSKLVDEAWLERSEKGFYTLSPRALMELKDWLVTTYNEPVEAGEEVDEELDKIKFCQACKDIVTIGQRCVRRKCRCRLHDICVQNFFRVQKSRRCPLCQTEWDGKHFVGEKAITTSESYLKGKRRSGARPAPTSDAIQEAEVSGDDQEG